MVARSINAICLAAIEQDDETWACVDRVCGSIVAGIAHDGLPLARSESVSAPTFDAGLVWK
jgi:hypothetical protein